MINSADEFVRLRGSNIEAENLRAGHEPAPLEVWLDVIANFPAMKSWVAHNKTVPVEVLELLARDCNDDVRFTVATKRKLSLELFESLAQDQHESVRHAIACNAKTPPHILERLVQDKEAFVAEAATRRVRKIART